MFKSQGHPKLWLAAAAAGFLTLGGCSNQPTDQATNHSQATAPAKKTDPGKPGGGKAAPMKPAAKKAETGKPISASSKVKETAKLVTVPKGTAISATVGQTLASNKNHSGDSFAASLSAPVKVGGKTVIPKGAHVTGRVVTAKKRGPAELTVALASVEIRGKSYALETNSTGPSGKSQAKNNTKDGAAAKEKKDIIFPTESHLKFKLTKSVKIPVRG